MLSKLSVSYISLRFRLGWDGDKFWWTLNKSRKQTLLLLILLCRETMLFLCVFHGGQIIQRNMFSPTLWWRRVVQLKGRKSCSINAHAAGANLLLFGSREGTPDCVCLSRKTFVWGFQPNFLCLLCSKLCLKIRLFSYCFGTASAVSWSRFMV